MIKPVLAIVIIWLVWTFIRRSSKPPGLQDAAQARAMLGVSADASADAIRTAHRRLMASAHPDRGGSADLATRLNAARDLLLKRAPD